MIYDDQSESWAPQPDGDGARPEDGSGQSRPRSAGGDSPSQMTAAATAAAAGGGCRRRDGATIVNNNLSVLEMPERYCT